MDVLDLELGERDGVWNFIGHSLSHGDRQCERVGGKNGKRIVGVGGGW